MYEYRIRESTRARGVRISVNTEGEVSVNVPKFFDLQKAHNFVQKKKAWIRRKVEYFLKHPVHPLVREIREKKLHTKKSYREYKEKSRALVYERLEHFNKIYNFEYGKNS